MVKQELNSSDVRLERQTCVQFQKIEVPAAQWFRSFRQHGEVDKLPRNDGQSTEQ